MDASRVPAWGYKHKVAVSATLCLSSITATLSFAALCLSRHPPQSSPRARSRLPGMRRRRSIAGRGCRHKSHHQLMHRVRECGRWPTCRRPPALQGEQRTGRAWGCPWGSGDLQLCCLAEAGALVAIVRRAENAGKPGFRAWLVLGCWGIDLAGAGRSNPVRAGALRAQPAAPFALLKGSPRANGLRPHGCEPLERFALRLAPMGDTCLRRGPIFRSQRSFHIEGGMIGHPFACPRRGTNRKR